MAHFLFKKLQKLLFLNIYIPEYNYRDYFQFRITIIFQSGKFVLNFMTTKY